MNVPDTIIGINLILFVIIAYMHDICQEGIYKNESRINYLYNIAIHKTGSQTIKSINWGIVLY